MKELIICRGVPASGKSTWAKAWVTADASRVRVNRDDLRFQLYGVYHGEQVDETLITKLEDILVLNALSANKSVVVDDTNIRASYVKRFAAIGQAEGARVEVKTFHIDIDEALRRNAARDRQVPEDVIRKMHYRLKSSGTVELPSPMASGKYVPLPGSKPAILVDIDGTIAHNDGHRSFYEWMKVGEDSPIDAVIEVVHWASDAGYEIVVMSGRDGECEGVTREWLDKYLNVNYELYMRPVGDQRQDSLVKRELFDAHVRNRFDVQFVLDDRNQVVDMWRAMGLRVFQVAPGNF